METCALIFPNNSVIREPKSESRGVNLMRGTFGDSICPCTILTIQDLLMNGFARRMKLLSIGCPNPFRSSTLHVVSTGLHPKGGSHAFS